jgi:hypothetical protein
MTLSHGCRPRFLPNVVASLIALGVGVLVRDETFYWPTRDPERALMNRIVARLARAFSDATPKGHAAAPRFSTIRSSSVSKCRSDADRDHASVRNVSSSLTMAHVSRSQ